jgi:4-hydroxy-tetrahydrodipicolinate synthase
MFDGSIVALVTPMDESSRVDAAGLRRLVDFQLSSGTSAIVVAGTTGESATLTTEEFEQLLEATLRQVDGRVPVIAGTGSADTARTIGRTRRAEALGADAALLVTPYYNRPPQAGLRAHYEAVAAATHLPLILYNVPGRTGVDLLPGTVAALADGDRFVAIKEAVPDPGRVHELLELVGDRMAVLSGDDPSCARSMAAGARGVISVAANVAPAAMARLCEAALAGDRDRAAVFDAELAHLYRQLAVQSNPIPVKWAAHRMGLIGPGIRLPLVPLAETHRPALEACLDDLGLLARQRTSV